MTRDESTLPVPDQQWAEKNPNEPEVDYKVFAVLELDDNLNARMVGTRIVKTVRRKSTNGRRKRRVHPPGMSGDDASTGDAETG
jgi:hypothetical protein